MKENNIQALINALSIKNDWISAQELASYLHTTTRTIRNYVTEINSRFPVPVILTSHSGYRWDSSSKSALPFLKEEVRFDTPEPRRQYILRELCFLNTENRTNELTIEELCERMSVSESTLSADIDQVRTELKNHRLRLRMRRDVLTLSGKESDIRMMILYLIGSSHQSINIDLLKRIFPSIQADHLSSVVKRELTDHGIDMDPYHYDSFLLLLIIQMMRIENDHLIIPKEVEIPNIEKRPEYEAAASISEFIREMMHISFNWWERSFLSLILICMSHRISPENAVYSEDIRTYVDGFVKHLENHDGISYEEDNFKQRLYDHIERLRFACRFHISISNPLRSSLRNYSPILHNYAAWIITGFQQKWNLLPDADQLSYFEMTLLSYRRKRKSRHFHIICTLVLPEYYGLEGILAEKIKDHFHKLIDIRHIVNICQTEALPDSDLYISLLPIKNKHHCVIISPALTPENYRAIQNEIGLIEQEMRYRQFEIYLRSYSRAAFFKRNLPCSSKEEAIDFALDELKKEGYVNDDIKKDILSRDRTDSVAYHNMLAIPHALTSNVNKNVIYVILNDKPITWENRRVNMVVLVAMERQLNNDFEQFLDVLIRLFESKNNMKLLLESNDYQSFLDKLGKIVS